MNPDKWEAVSSAADSGVMVSNLPLLFADGKPASLDTILLEQLQKFFPFMVKCSIGEDQSVPWSQLPKPPWWPTRLPFRVPQNPSPVTTRSLLVRLVTRCYDYHSCPYLLQFCTTLVGLQHSPGYKLSDNGDGTTSMYHGVTGKQLVTFRNENRDYDKSTKDSRTPRSHLLPSLNKNKKSPRNEGIVPPPCLDVYLCDQCDNEFSTLKDVQEHEKSCQGNEASIPQVPSPESDSTDEDAPNPSDNTYLLKVLGLQPVDSKGSVASTPRKIHRSPTKQFYRNYYRYVNMDICSPFGQEIVKKLRNSPKGVIPEQPLKYEKHVDAKPFSNYAPNTERPKRWLTTYKTKRSKAHQWTHEMCFNKEQRQEKTITLETGLDYESRMLFVKHCKPVDVRVGRLSLKAAAKYEKPVEKTPFVDLTGSPTTVAEYLIPASKSSIGNAQNGISPTTKQKGKRVSCPSDRNALNQIVNEETQSIIKKLPGSIQVQPILSSVPQVIDIASSSDEESSTSVPVSHNQKNGVSHWLPSASDANGCYGLDVVVNGSSNPSLHSKNTKNRSPNLQSQQLSYPLNLSQCDRMYQENQNASTDTTLLLQMFVERLQKQNMTSNMSSKKRRRRSLHELKYLLSDECRELKNRGLYNLYAIDTNENVIRTRCFADNVRTQMFDLARKRSRENIDDDILFRKKKLPLMKEILLRSSQKNRLIRFNGNQKDKKKDVSSIASKRCGQGQASPRGETPSKEVKNLLGDEMKELRLLQEDISNRPKRLRTS